MPVPTRIAGAAHSFQLNNDLLKKGLDGLNTEEWLRSPGASSNHILWIVGHVIWARVAVLGLLGSEWSRPWLSLFGRGAKPADAAEYPTPEEATLAFEEVSARLTAALEGASEETLSKPSPERIPSADGQISGVLNFLAYHETIHVGQVAYLRKWLGHSGVAG
jgi:hypothetical protein